MPCTRCGFEPSAGDRLCPKCGAPVTGAPTMRQESGLQFEYAGFWRRLIAILIDGLILAIPAAIIVSIFNAEGGGRGISFAIVSWLYFALMESSAKQATLGKRAMGIVVVDTLGRRILLWKATVRHISKYISFMVLFVGFIMAAFTEKKQALHDMIAACLVIRKESL